MKYSEELDRVSYCFGLSIASNLISSGVTTINAEAFNDAMTTVFAGNMPEIMPDEANNILQDYFEKLQKERGGKAIAVSFGVMIGLFPEIHPLFCLIFYYILFSLVLTLRPHSFRSVITYGLFTLTVFLFVPVNSIRLGCCIISAIVIYRHVIRCHDEALQALLFGKYPLFHKS